jgi:hypothetical protein
MTYQQYFGSGDLGDLLDIKNIEQFNSDLINNKTGKNIIKMQRWVPLLSIVTALLAAANLRTLLLKVPTLHTTVKA